MGTSAIPIQNLAELPIGLAARVTALPNADGAMTRLRELGLLPGTSVRLLRRGPTGDPLEICLRGCLLSLRAADAQRITVEVA